MSGLDGMTIDQLERRAATDADVPFLLSLRHQTMTAHQLLAGLIPSEEERRARVLMRFECAQVLSRSGQPVGVLKVARDGREWELIQIQLLPEYQRHGLGGQLIQSITTEATEAGAEIRLSVLKGSPARRLYERHGFTVLRHGEHATTMVFQPDESVHRHG
jgi:ribosomal protein S18 acetylase RimI-like enzyme